MVTLMSDTVVGSVFKHFPGILSQTEWKDELKKHGDSYIPASYVKYIEAAGARVVPILVNQTDLYYDKMFNSMNGYVSFFVSWFECWVKDKDTRYLLLTGQKAISC